jgi:hypothetical protein
MEKFIQTEKVKIHEMHELFEQCLETYANLYPNQDEATQSRMKLILRCAISAEIDFLCDDPAMYKELYYPD